MTIETETTMAITLWQPWASLVAIGAKKIETRSWYTSYRGRLAIHAAKSTPKHALKYAWLEPFFSALRRGGLRPDSLLSGVIVATCDLRDCRRISTKDQMQPGELEIFFGDFTPGRYAWYLDNIVALGNPVPTRGHQGLWRWTPRSNDRQEQL